MSLTNPITGPTHLRRWPFQRRPVAKPGSDLVFQRSSGVLVHPETPMMAADISLRGLREMYEVDTRTHGSSFQCKLPSRNTALEFEVAVTYSWRVDNPLTVVREKVVDAPAACRAHLTQLMRPICRRIKEHDEDLAESRLNDGFPNPIPLPERGIVVTAVIVEVRSDAEVLGLGREHYTQAGTLQLHQLRVDFFDRIVRDGNTVANILAQDPTKAEAAAVFLDRQLENDRRVAVEAMKIIIDGDAVRYGEIDDAVGAVVERFRSIIAQPPSLAQAASSGRPAVESSASEVAATETGQGQIPAARASEDAGDS